MLDFIPAKVWLGFGVAIALVAALKLYGNHQYNLGVSATQAQWQAQIAELALAYDAQVTELNNRAARSTKRYLELTDAWAKARAQREKTNAAIKDSLSNRECFTARELRKFWPPKTVTGK